VKLAGNVFSPSPAAQFLFATRSRWPAD